MGTLTNRGYDSRWRKARAAFLAKHPFCHYCYERGKRVMAQHVDHSVPHKGDMKLFWRSDLWRPLCVQCHLGAKAKEQHAGHVIGCAPDGTPLNPSHHWNTENATQSALVGGGCEVRGGQTDTALAGSCVQSRFEIGPSLNARTAP